MKLNFIRIMGMGHLCKGSGTGRGGGGGVRGALAPPSSPILDLCTWTLCANNWLLCSLSRQPSDRISVPPPLHFWLNGWGIYDLNVWGCYDKVSCCFLFGNMLKQCWSSGKYPFKSFHDLRFQLELCVCMCVRMCVCTSLHMQKLLQQKMARCSS